MKKSVGRRRPATSAGFSMMELLVVIGIISMVAVTAFPAFNRYLRNYQIRGATQQVASELVAARNKAIVKNVNLGVVFVTRSATTYQWVVEDDQTGTGGSRTTVRPTLNATLLGNAQTGAGRDNAQTSPVYSLPTRTQFSTACPGQPALPAGGVWKNGMRFNRLGAWCDPGATGCPALDSGAGANLVFNISSTGGNATYPSGSSVICVAEIRANPQSRTVTVLGGGRVLSQP